MKYLTFTACILLVLSLSALGFDSPDFSGTWIPDKANSGSMGGSTGRNIQTPFGSIVRQSAGSLIQMTVQQSAGSLAVEAYWSDGPETHATYILDGNEHSVTGGNGISQIYRATFSEEQLRIEGFKKISTPFGPTERKNKEEWSLSADKQILTILTTESSPSSGDQTQKKIYTRGQ